MSAPDLGPALAALARPGGLVVYPTETLYGLGGLARDAAAARRIGALKGREASPLIVLIAARPAGLTGRTAALAEALWPGPVTLIVAADQVEVPGGVAPEVLGDGTVALRWTRHPVARALIAAAGPLTSTSANRHGEPPLLDPSRCALAVDAVIDAGPVAIGLPSTLVDTRTGTVLRQGAALASVRSALAAAGWRP